jgi:hypothetical protein
LRLLLLLLLGMAKASVPAAAAAVGDSQSIRACSPAVHDIVFQSIVAVFSVGVAQLWIL